MTEIPDRGHFALVAYVPDPLASFLYEMRRSFSELPCPQPHVTILPPRPLRVPVESACQTAKKTLQLQSQFEVELSRLCYFTNTNTLYLDISDGASEIHALHNSLNHGDLYYHEEFAFRPHLTIAGRVDPLQFPAVLQEAETNWHAASCSPRFLLSEVVCLLQESGKPKGNWRRLWSVKLNPLSANHREQHCHDLRYGSNIIN
jgi:2'-5' RNA ligase